MDRAVDDACPSELDLRVLGSLQIHVQGRPMPVRAAKVRALAASLMVRAGRVTQVEGLMADLWQDEPPRSAVANIRTYATQLRRLLPPGRLLTVDSGYRLLVGADELDLDRTRALAAGGRQALADGDLSLARHLLDLACLQWRGRPLDGLPAGPGLDAVRVALEEEHRTLVQLRVRAGLAVGRVDEVLPLARAGAVAHPLVESAQELLMLALWHHGDHAGALHVYSTTRTALVRELGIEPGEALRRLHRGLLASDPAPPPLPDLPPDRRAGPPPPEQPRHLCQAPPRPAVPRPHPAVRHREAPATDHEPCPHELPPPVDLLGRTAERDVIEAALRAGRVAPGGPTVVSVHGRAGSGTSSLVVTAAHVSSAAFPDGQVYVDLDEAEAIRPVELVRRVLRSLVDGTARQPPRSVHEASAQLRSALHGRRVLVVLDNVVDAEQVLPVLSPSPGVAVLVASGPMLATLDTSVHVGIGPLGTDDAMALLERSAGRRMSAHERISGLAVIDLCERLPAAIRIAGARLASRADLSLTALARLLGDETRRLEELTFGSRSVHRGLQQRYRALVAAPEGALAARVYEALGSVRGPVVTAEELSDASGEPEMAAVRGALGRLVHLRLVEPIAEDMFLLPDLVRLHARHVGVGAAWPVLR